MIKAAIFDFDGTIANTEPIWCDIVKSILEEQDCDKEFNYEIWKKNYQHQPNVSKRIIEDYDLNMTEEELRNIRNQKFIAFCKEDYIVNHNFLHNIRNKAVIADLKSLNKRTNNCHLVSCSREDAVRNALKTLGIENLFKSFHFSVEDKKTVYKNIVEQEGLSYKDVVLYEDSNDNIKIAKELGMLSFLVHN